MRRFVGLIAVLTLSSLTACDYVFGLSGDRADAGPDTSFPPDDDVGPGHCSSITMIGTDFEDGEYLTSFPGSYTPTRVTVENGELTLTHPLVESYVTLESIFYYDADEQPITFKFRDTGILPGNGNSANISIDGDVPEKSVIITRRDDQLVFSVADGTPKQVVASFPYDPSKHAYVKVLLANNTVALATSADGMTWDPVATRTLTDMTFVSMRVQTYSPGTDALVFALDDLIGGRRAGSACPASDLRENFEATTLSRIWSPSANHGFGVLENGQLHMSTEPVYPEDAYSFSLRSARLYNLVDNALAVEIPQMVSTMSSTQKFALRISSRTQDQIDFVQQGGVLTAAFYKPDGTTITADSGAYDPTTMRWWRIRNAGGTTIWEVSGDAVTWMFRGSRPGVQGLEAASVLLQLYSTSAQEEHVRIDNINVTP